MSSRFSISRVSRSRDSSAVARSSAWAAGVHWTRSLRSEVTDALAEASGLRRSWLTAASSAERVRSASSTTLASSARLASWSRSRTAAAWAAKAASSRWSAARTGPSTRSRSRSPTGTSVVAAPAGRARPTWSISCQAPAVSERSRRVSGLEAEGLAGAAEDLRQRGLAAQDAAGETGQHRRLGGGAAGLRRTPDHALDEDRDQGAHGDEHQQGEGVVLVGDREGVERWGEVVVEQEAADDRCAEGRPEPADQRHQDHDAEVEQDVAGQVEVAAQLRDSTNVEQRQEHERGDGALHPPAQAERGGQAGDRERRQPVRARARPRG